MPKCVWVKLMEVAKRERGGGGGRFCVNIKSALYIHYTLLTGFQYTHKEWIRERGGDFAMQNSLNFAYSAKTAYMPV